MGGNSGIAVLAGKIIRVGLGPGSGELTCRGAVVSGSRGAVGRALSWAKEETANGADGAQGNEGQTRAGDG